MNGSFVGGNVMNVKGEMRIKGIENGTVIDHIKSGQALNVLRILGISSKSAEVLSIAMNVPSKLTHKKDIVKVEGRELSPSEVNKIALITPDATINIVRDSKVIEKHKVSLPNEITGVLRCANANCISNTSEPVKPRFIISKEPPVKLRCFYCDRLMVEDVVEHLLF